MGDGDERKPKTKTKPTRFAPTPEGSPSLSMLLVLHPLLLVHLPADVDLEAGVRRVRPIHCPPQVLLSVRLLSIQFINKILNWNFSTHSKSYISTLLKYIL